MINIENWSFRAQMFWLITGDCTLVFNNFMAYGAVWGHLPIRGQNTNSKKLTIKNLSKSGLRRFVKFGQAHSNDERKITLSLNLHFIWDFRI